MIALKIVDVPVFMSQLLKGEAFDNLWLGEASITTFNTFTIDGSLHLDFFDPVLSRSLDCMGRTHSLWSEVKPFCLSIIRGKRVPLHFKIVFLLPSEEVERALEGSDTGILPEQVAGLFLNLQYNGRELTCTTGTSLHLFTLDKSLDVLWDNLALAFFRQHGIAYEML